MKLSGLLGFYGVNSIYLRALKGLNQFNGAIDMPWRSLVCLCIILVGVTLFLYGSNSYNAIVGWTGICLIILGILSEIILKVYGYIRKRGTKEQDISKL
jgi:hypothetical protein